MSMDEKFGSFSESKKIFLKCNTKVVVIAIIY